MKNLKNRRLAHRFLSAAALVLAGGGLLRADVTMPAVFGDHMILQQDLKLPVWGTADAGEKVKITVGDKSAETTAGADGKWRVDLAPLPTSSKPLTVVVKGKNTLTFNDVLVGDVWVCSGQSNMQFALSSAHNKVTEIPKASDPQLRLFFVPKLPHASPPTPGDNAWVVCSPEQAKRFSAVAYFFGCELRSNLNRPIGLIGSYVGGTPVEAWTGPASRDLTNVTPEAKATFNQRISDYPKAYAAYVVELDKWNQDFGVALEASTREWAIAVAKAKAAGEPLPTRPVPTTPAPLAPPDPEGAGGLFNGMIRPVIPYGIKGAIWYQGEANTGGAEQYQAKFSHLITSWREKWSEGDFPFLFVQLARYKGDPGQDWPLLREAQLKTLSLPNTGMASVVDIGDPRNIHPGDKLDVGLRLGLAAKHVAYGQTLVYSGPIYDSMKVDGNTIRVRFTQTGGGLIVGSAPWVPPGLTALPTDKLIGFSIAGADKTWVAAEAKIDGNMVVVSSPQVATPLAVRYGWANAPEMNLYNKENLPASPFRTDDWPTTPEIPRLLPVTPVPTPAVAPSASPTAK